MICGLNFVLDLHLHPCIVYASRENSGECGHICVDSAESLLFDPSLYLYEALGGWSLASVSFDHC